MTDDCTPDNLCALCRPYFPNAEQPDPTPNNSTPIVDLVIEDMKKRKELGIERYGTPLQKYNGRCALTDAYEEALDLAIYLKQALEEKYSNE